jgi:hypothetical protein
MEADGGKRFAGFSMAPNQLRKSEILVFLASHILTISEPAKPWRDSLIQILCEWKKARAYVETGARVLYQVGCSRSFARS